jgi:HTH-type transcriptional regulator/antitoxin HipB
MISTPKDLAQAVKQTRKQMGVTQKVLALTSGTGLRFINDLEKGKPTCHIGKVLTVLRTLGIKLELIMPAGDVSFEKRPTPQAAGKRLDHG